MPGVVNSSFQRLRAALLALWLLGTGGLVWLLLIFPGQSSGASYRDVVRERAADEALEPLLLRLQREGLIEKPSALLWYLRLLGADDRLRSGPIVVNRALAPRDLVMRLAKGFGLASVRVPMPEGFTSFDMAIRLARYGVCARGEFERAVRDPALLAALGIPGTSAEGYLFPATYDLNLDTSAELVVRQMVRIFRERMSARLRAYEAAHDGQPLALTTHQIVTLASIVEREARVPEERPTIAGVFMNRLTSPDFRPHRLQADPTVAYGCLVARDRVPSCATFDGKRITPAMVRDPENPYSTYRIEGLPPGPISNPGLSALEAALAPAQHEFFYFVTHGGGRHHFTRTLEEHNQRVHNPP
jgi:UPF0755 protein